MAAYTRCRFAVLFLFPLAVSPPHFHLCPQQARLQVAEPLLQLVIRHRFEHAVLGAHGVGMDAQSLCVIVLPQFKHRKNAGWMENANSLQVPHTKTCFPVSTAVFVNSHRVQ